MAIERLQVGANSASYFVTGEADTTFFFGRATWAELQEGKLKNLLNRAYLDEGDNLDVNAFLRAFAESGARLTGLTYGGVFTDFGFALDASGPGEPDRGFPYLAVTMPPAGAVTFSITVSYSASE